MRTADVITDKHVNIVIIYLIKAKHLFETMVHSVSITPAMHIGVTELLKSCAHFDKSPSFRTCAPHRSPQKREQTQNGLFTTSLSTFCRNVAVRGFFALHGTTYEFQTKLSLTRTVYRKPVTLISRNDFCVWSSGIFVTPYFERAVCFHLKLERYSWVHGIKCQFIYHTCFWQYQYLYATVQRKLNCFIKTGRKQTGRIHVHE